jgi:Fe2+ or Zn2+ uptake regulation protein
MTGPRQLLLQHLLKRSGSFSAEEIAREVPAASRATVFRTLKLLVDWGFVCKIPLGDGTPRYRVGVDSHHHHLICIICGNVREFDRCAVDDILRRVEQDTEYTVVGHRIELYALCEECRFQLDDLRRDGYDSQV